MARKVSPGVFTNEIDQSYLAQGVGAIGAAVIGRTRKGPAFIPTQVTSFQTEFVPKLGDVDPALMAPYAVQNYLKNSAVCTVVRVLGTKNGISNATNGWTHKVLVLTGTGGDVLAQLHVLSGTQMTLTGTGSSFGFSFSGSSGQFTGTFAGSASMDPSQSNWIGHLWNFDPTAARNYGHYVYKLFEWAGSGSGAPFGSASLAGATTKSFDYDYTTPSTPWVQSQPFGTTVYNLFRVWALGAGADATTETKVSIENIQASSYPSLTPYGTFDLVVRAWSDTDSRPVVIESFTGLTLDPSSSQYLPRVIGDEYSVWDANKYKNVTNGQFKNNSQYIRIEMAVGNDPPETSVPWGHSGYPENGLSVVDVPWVANNLDAQGNLVGPQTWGINYAAAGVADRLKALAAPGSASQGSAFSLSHLSGATTGGLSYTVYNTGTSANAPSTGSANGFTMAFYGGFDGWDMTMADPLDPDVLTALPTYVGTIGLKFAVDTVSNPDEIDINLAAMPGVTAPSVTSYLRTMCNARADCMAIIDIDGSSVAEAISSINTMGVDDNYAATYYPNLKLADATNNVQVEVSPSVAVLGALAQSDAMAYPWFAAAGLNRGGLAAFGIVDTTDRLTFTDRDQLYQARINPIATFPNEGIVVWGQKTLQFRPSALDRINVRRLLIYAKKTVAAAAKLLLFEPNNPQTWTRFLNTVNPIFADIQVKQGLQRFKVVMDTTTNTPDLIDRNEMVGKIFLQPTKAAEFISLSFIISASGVEFEE